MSNVPENLKYAESHEWVSLDGDIATIGITDHAQAELSDVVYVELPDLEREVEPGEQVCIVESVKAASDIYSPVAGTVTEVNSALESDCPLVNSDPYEKGWLFKVKVSNPGDLDALKDAAAYKAFIGE